MWEPSLSPHKLDLFHALQAHPRVDSVTYIADKGLAEERAAQGWSVDVRSVDQIVIAPTSSDIADIVGQAPGNSVHIFSGMRAIPTIVEGLRVVQRHKLPFGLMSEPRVLEGPQGLARLLQSWLTERKLRRGAKFVLAIGRNGPAWFALAGYSKKRIYPFAYYVDQRVHDWPLHASSSDEGPIKLGFVGRLETSKGIDILLEALSHVSAPIALNIAGRGSLEEQVTAVASKRSDVHYFGTLDIKKVRDFLENLDLLVLPSTTTDDGWGVVVSEALLEGTAVLVSKKAGASVCPENHDLLGETISTLTPQSVAAGIDICFSKIESLRRDRFKRRSWAENRLTGVAGAAYLMHILDHAFHSSGRPRAFFQ